MTDQGMPLWMIVVGAMIAFFIVSAIYEIVTGPAPSPEGRLGPNDSRIAIKIATWTVGLDLSDSPDSAEARGSAKDLQKQLHALFDKHPVWRDLPQVEIRLVAVRSGSLYFDYDIYVLVLGTATTVLKNYSVMKKGLGDIFEDTKTIRVQLAKAFYKRWPVAVKATELRVMTEAEITELVNTKKATSERKAAREVVVVQVEEERRR